MFELVDVRSTTPVHRRSVGPTRAHLREHGCGHAHDRVRESDSGTPCASFNKM